MFVYVKVQARNEEAKYVPRARRFWPAGQTLKVEVLDTDEDGADVTIASPGGKPVTVPDMERIGKLSYAALRDDSQGRFTILNDPEAETSISAESVQAAKQEVERVSGELLQLRAEHAALKGHAEMASKEIDRLNGWLAEAQTEIARLRAEASPPASAPTGPLDAIVAVVSEDAKPAKSAKAGK